MSQVTFDISGVQRDPKAQTAPPIVHEVLGAPGRPLEPGVRGEMEARFGHDFSQVRVHADGRAAESARAVTAAAYTVGSDVVFAAERYAPTTAEGSRLLAHELAHVVQQSGSSAPARDLPVQPADHPAEVEARRASTGGAAAQPLGRAAPAVARQMIGNENQWVPDALQDKQLVELFRQVWGRLTDKTRPTYPERENDLQALEALKFIAGRRSDERKAAVAEAERVIAGMGAEETETPPPAPAQPELTKELLEQGAVPATVEFFQQLKASRAELEEEYAPARRPGKFEDRLAAAKRGAEPTSLTADFPQSVWEYGLTAGYFAAYEQGAVLQTLNAPNWERVDQELKHDRMMAQYRREQEFESFRFQLNAQFIQAALMGGPKAPAMIRVPYTAFGTAQSGVEIYQGIRTGDPSRVVGGALPLAAGYAYGRIAGVGGGSEPEPPLPGRPPGGGGPGGGGGGAGGGPSGGPVEITANEVRAWFQTNPYSVKKMLTGASAQRAWVEHGGPPNEVHPLAWRHPEGRVVYVDEALWPTVGDLAEINLPHQLGPRGQVPQAYAPTVPDPLAPTQPPPTPAPAGPGTIPSVQPVPGVAPRPVRPAAPAGPSSAPTERAFPVSDAVAVASYENNPASVHGSISSNWHRQAWRISLGEGPAPPLFKSGRVVIVDPARVSVDLLSQLGMGMRLR